MSTINALWQKLVTREKALFKSATIYLSLLVTSLPDILTYVQANWPTVAGYLPHAWQDRSLSLIGVAIFVCRLRSMVKIPAGPSA